MGLPNIFPPLFPKQSLNFPVYSIPRKYLLPVFKRIEYKNQYSIAKSAYHLIGKFLLQ